MVARRVVLFFAVDDRQFLEEKDREKSDEHRHHQRPYRNPLVKRRLGHLRDEIEKCDAEPPSILSHFPKGVSTASNATEPTTKSDI